MKKIINDLYYTTFGFVDDFENVPNRWSLSKNKIFEYAKKMMNEYSLECNVEDEIDVWETKSDKRLVVDENGTVIIEYFDKEDGRWGKIYEFESVYRI